MARLLLLFILVPVIELALLIEIGKRVGLLPTLGLIVVTGIAGAALARQQGLGILERLRSEMGRGALPTDTLVDGALVLMAAAVLLTPGVLTDAFGFLCLIPASRKIIRKGLKRWLGSLARRGNFRFSTFPQGPSRREGFDGMKNVTPADGQEPAEAGRPKDSNLP